MPNELSSHATDTVLRFQEALREHVIPWAIYEKLHRSCDWLRWYRFFLYFCGICCIICTFVPQLSSFALKWGLRLYLTYPIAALLYLLWWTRLLRRGKPLPCRVSGTARRLFGLHLLPVEDLRGKSLGWLLVGQSLFRQYGFARLQRNDQLTALQTRLLFWKLLLPSELVFDTLQTEMANLIQKWEEH